MIKADLKDLVHNTVVDLGGTASVLEVAKEIWRTNETQLRSSGDLFYTWQYDMRWAAQKLRDDGILTLDTRSGRSVWKII